LDLVIVILGLFRFLKSLVINVVPRSRLLITGYHDLLIALVIHATILLLAHLGSSVWPRRKTLLWLKQEIFLVVSIGWVLWMRRPLPLDCQPWTIAG